MAAPRLRPRDAARRSLEVDHRAQRRLVRLLIADLAFLEVDVIPAERQNAAQPTPRAPSQKNQRTQERMHGGRDREQHADRRLLHDRALGVLLCRNLVLLQRVPREERPTALVLLARPNQGRLEHPEVAVHRVRPARDRKSTRLNSIHTLISYPFFCLQKKTPPRTT